MAITDVSTGLYAYGSIMAALIQRQRTGRGQKIECNLLSTQVWMIRRCYWFNLLCSNYLSLVAGLQVATLVNIGSNYLNSGIEGRRWGTAHESIVPYEVIWNESVVYRRNHH